MLGDAMGFHKSLMELKPGGVVYMKLTLKHGMSWGDNGMPWDASDMIDKS